MINVFRSQSIETISNFVSSFQGKKSKILRKIENLKKKTKTFGGPHDQIRSHFLGYLPKTISVEEHREYCTRDEFSIFRYDM